MAERDGIMNTPEHYNHLYSSSILNLREIRHARSQVVRSRMSVLNRSAPDEALQSVVRVLNFDDDLPPSTSRSRPHTPMPRPRRAESQVSFAERLRRADSQLPVAETARRADSPVSDAERPRRADSPVSDAESNNWSPQERSARNIASRLLFHARTNICIDERALQCLNCGMLPLMPVTGLCGHTRCLECIQRGETCLCGIAHTPWLLNVNTLIQELIQKILATEPNIRLWMTASQDVVNCQSLQYNSPMAVCMNENQPEAPLKNIQAVTTADGDRTSKEQSAVKQNEESVVKCDDVHIERNDTMPDKSDAPMDTGTPMNTHNNHVSEEGACNPVNVSTPSIEEKETSGHLSRLPITPQARLQYARHLIQEGQHKEAVPHLARAASAVDVARPARQMLTQAILELSRTRDVSELEAELREAICAQATSKWLSQRELECVFCYDTISKPVTTPCGHTFCQQCLERSLDYRSTCALCMQVLHHLNFSDLQITEFVHQALVSIGAIKSPPPQDPNVIPILACTVAFPGMPCPLFLFDPRYWYMIRRILESESRRFGMVAFRRDGMYSEYGTILEMRDCVYLEDGCTIVSTIGISRFRVVERDVWDGWYDAARVVPVVDIAISSNGTVDDLRTLARHISFKAALWISGISPALRAKIQSAFGAMPHIDADGHWWNLPDGPAWLWWIISILPINLEIKILILATNSLVKRMRAVLRTLDTSLAQPRQSVWEYETSLAIWWQQRHL